MIQLSLIINTTELHLKNGNNAQKINVVPCQDYFESCALFHVFNNVGG